MASACMQDFAAVVMITSSWSAAVDVKHQENTVMLVAPSRQDELRPPISTTHHTSYLAGRDARFMPRTEIQRECIHEWAA